MVRMTDACLVSLRHAELVSASHRESFLVLLRGQILKQVQDDFGRFLLFLHSFWSSQFNILSKTLITHRSSLNAQRRL